VRDFFLQLLAGGFVYAFHTGLPVMLSVQLDLSKACARWFDADLN
jgi:hypothetical protein